MARAYGANIQVCAHFETVYGAPPSGDWIKLPIVSTTLGAEQPLIANAVLGLGREPVDPLRDVIRDEGDVVVPVDVRNFGHWLKLLLGPPVTTGAGPYVHTFTSGAAVLPSLAMEIGMPEVPKYFVHGGTMANTMALRFERSGRAPTSQTGPPSAALPRAKPRPAPVPAVVRPASLCSSSPSFRGRSRKPAPTSPT